MSISWKINNGIFQGVKIIAEGLRHRPKIETNALSSAVEGDRFVGRLACWPWVRVEGCTGVVAGQDTYHSAVEVSGRRRRWPIAAPRGVRLAVYDVKVAGGRGGGGRPKPPTT